MSLFGGIDISDVPDAIIKDTYLCELKKVDRHFFTKKEEDKKLEKNAYILRFEVCDEDSEFLGETAEVFINIFSSSLLGYDAETKKYTYEGHPLDSDVQTEIRNAIRFFKNVVANLGFDPEIHKDLKDLAGNKYYVPMFPDKETKKARISTNEPIRPATDIEDSDIADLDI